MDVAVPLRPRLNEFGEAERPKFGGGRTVRETDVLRDKAPETPVTVIVNVPRAAVLLADSVRVLVVVVLPGLNAAVMPLGRPEAERLTLPLNPLSGLTVTVLVPLAPWATLTLLGEAESV